jgi:hypothetical protein
MSKVQVDNAFQHASIRIYIGNCTYQSASWQDNPNILHPYIKSALNILNFTYKTIKIIGVRKALATELEIHIGDITYKSSDRLNATDIDIVKSAIQTALNTIAGFAFNTISIVSDKFHEEPLTGFNGKSMTRVK